MTEAWHTWPAQLRERITALCGAIRSVQRLGGMSIASVYRVRGERGTAIVKVSPRPAEFEFYSAYAPTLVARAVPLVGCSYAGEHDGQYWLVLEDLPIQLKPNLFQHWSPDNPVLQALVRLHAATMADPPPFERSPQRWTPGMTSGAREVLGTSPGSATAEILQRFEQRSERLSQAWCWVSGDPSPPNWGGRRDGSIVLFDWELFRPGVPASDLAPIAVGLPGTDVFRAIASAYIRAAEREDLPLPWTIDELTSDTIVAKAATVVAMLSAHRHNRARIPADYLAELVAAFPAWLTTMAPPFVQG